MCGKLTCVLIFCCKWKLSLCRPCCPLSPNHLAVDSWRWPWDLWQHWLCPVMMEILRAALCHRWTHTHTYFISNRKIWVESGMFNGSLFVFIYTQVHALNILRALYRDTRLGENIVPFVSEGMQAAILGFTSPVWAVSVPFYWIELNFIQKDGFSDMVDHKICISKCHQSTIMPFY